MKRFFSAKRSAYISSNAGILCSEIKKLATNDLYNSLSGSKVRDTIDLTVPIGTAIISPSSFTITSFSDIFVYVKGNKLYIFF